jgi:superfamily II DNA or RNA helicase
MTAPTLLNLLAKVIRLNPGSTAQELRSHLLQCEQLSVTRYVVNSLLYANRHLFISDGGYIPRWSSTQTTISVKEPRPRQNGATTAASITRAGLYAWQREALKDWESAGCTGVVEAVTGAGKTRVGLVAATEELLRGGKVLVLVPTLELLRQWYEKLLECAPRARVNRLGGGHRANFRSSDVIVATLNSARDRDLFPPRGEGLLIADECHRNGSERNKDSLDERFPRRLGLSATYARNDDGNADWLDPYFGGVCFRLGYERALRDGVIAHFTAALIGVRFSATEREEYDDYSDE